MNVLITNVFFLCVFFDFAKVLCVFFEAFFLRFFAPDLEFLFFCDFFASYLCRVFVGECCPLFEADGAPPPPDGAVGPCLVGPCGQQGALHGAHLLRHCLQCGDPVELRGQLSQAVGGRTRLIWGPVTWKPHVPRHCLVAMYKYVPFPLSPASLRSVPPQTMNKCGTLFDYRDYYLIMLIACCDSNLR